MIHIPNKSKEFKNDSLSWPSQDIAKLLSRMRLHIPENDSLKHQSRAARLPWNLITFDDYTDSVCQHMWNLIFQRIRGYRLLEEVLSDAVEWLKHPWTDFYGAKTKNKHPDYPKKPRSAFLLYCADHMGRVKEQFPKLSLPERTKYMAEQYRNLKDKKKLKYGKKAELCKQEYYAQLEIFLAEHPEVTDGREIIRKQPRKITAFNLYVEDQHKNGNVTKKTPKDAFTLLRKQWNELSADDQLPWLQAAEEKQKEIIMTDPSAKSTLTKAEKKIHDRYNGKPDKPPSNVYSLYSKKMLGSGILAEYSPQERMKEIGRRWKTIDAKEQADLSYELMEEKMQYGIDLKKYLKQHPEEASMLKNENLNDSIDGKKKRKRNFEILEVESTNGNLDDSIGDEKKKSKTSEVESTSTLNDSPKTRKRKHDKVSHKPKIDPETIVEKKKKTRIEEKPEEDLNVSLNDTLSQEISLFKGEPKPPPKSPIKLFSKSMKKQKVKFASEEELNEAWANLSSSERKNYKKALKNAKEAYLTEFEAFLCSLSSKDLKQYQKKKVVTV